MGVENFLPFRLGFWLMVVGLVLVYLAGTIFTVWRLRSRLMKWEPFSATLAELKKDKACLDEKN